MASGAEAPLLRANPDLSWRSGQYSYRIARQGDQTILFRDRWHRSPFPAQSCGPWAKAKPGRPTRRARGRLYESRASYYEAIKGLDVTIGPTEGTPDSLLKAFGRFMSTGDVVACLNCHSVKQPGAPATLRSGSVEWAQARVSGVHCEHCHMSPMRHAAARTRRGHKNRQDAPFEGLGCRRNVRTLRQMPPHLDRHPQQWPQGCRQRPVPAVPDRAEQVLRPVRHPHQLHRCHDPHNRPKAEPGSCDKVCASCHRPGEKTAKGRRLPLCKTAKSNCVSCHMPEYEIPLSHWKFADHCIRIARPGAPYPG